VRQIPWSHHLQILGQCKLPEEREFYLRMAVQEGWSKRQLERQIRAALFERTVLSPPKVAPVVREIHPGLSPSSATATRWSSSDYPRHTEAELHRGLINSLREFLIELGRDFCFIGSEVPPQVGNQDFALDLLFFDRGLAIVFAKVDACVEALRDDVPTSPADSLRRATAMPLGVVSCGS
jgi:predicted nuclease of restriction endonuclease-like (RecB) superfamily